MAAKKPLKLRDGPYRSPDCRPGDRLVCRIVGARTVLGMTEAPVPWPFFQRGKGRRLFVCGDLERALSREATLVIGRLFGTTASSAIRWRRVLGIEPVGSPFPKKITDSQVEDLRARAAAGESQASLAREFGITGVYAWMIVHKRVRVSRRRPAG